LQWHHTQSELCLRWKAFTYPVSSVSSSSCKSSDKSRETAPSSVPEATGVSVLLFRAEIGKWLFTQFLPLTWEPLQKICVPQIIQMRYLLLSWRSLYHLAPSCKDQRKGKKKKSSQNYINKLKTEIPLMLVNARLAFMKNCMGNEFSLYIQFFKACF
jgi:hypothetical protein